MTDTTTHGHATDDAAASVVFAGAGEMAARCRAFEWAATPLGPVADWPPSLRTVGAAVVATGLPAILLWGPALLQLYNDAYVPFLGVKHPAALAAPTRACWPEVWHINAPVYDAVRRGESVTLVEQPFPIHRAGPDAPVDVLHLTISYAPVRDETGVVAGVFVTIVDVTAQVLGRAAEAERQRLEARLHGTLLEASLVLDQMSDAYVRLDGTLRIVAVNPSAERDLGLARGALLGRPFADVFPTTLEAERTYRQVADDGVKAHLAQRYSDGARDLHVEVDAYPADFDAHGTRGVALFWRDVTARVRAEQATREASATLAAHNAALETRVRERTAALADTNTRLQAEVAARARGERERNALLRRLDSAQEAERRHLARELHDEVGQHLTALGLGLGALADAAPPESDVAHRVTALRAMAETLGRDLHALALQLRPRVLDDFGLEAALGTYAEAWSRRHGIEVTMHAAVGAGRLSAAVENAVYRIVQEALTNVARHSGARDATVIVERRGGQLCVAVEDDGRGFDQAPAPGPTGGLGLLGIRERATLLGGTADLESAPGLGATLFVRLPLDPPDDPAPTAEAERDDR